MAFNMSFFRVPECSEAAVQIDELLGSVSTGLTAAPHIARTAIPIARNVDNVIPFGSFGDSITSSRYSAAERAFNIAAEF